MLNQQGLILRTSVCPRSQTWWGGLQPVSTDTQWSLGTHPHSPSAPPARHLPEPAFLCQRALHPFLLQESAQPPVPGTLQHAHPLTPGWDTHLPTPWVTEYQPSSKLTLGSCRYCWGSGLMAPSAGRFPLRSQFPTKHSLPCSVKRWNPQSWFMGNPANKQQQAPSTPPPCQEGRRGLSHAGVHEQVPSCASTGA